MFETAPDANPQAMVVRIPAEATLLDGSFSGLQTLGNTTRAERQENHKLQPDPDQGRAEAVFDNPQQP